MYPVDEGLDAVVMEDVLGLEEDGVGLEEGAGRPEGYGSEASRVRWAGVVREAAPKYSAGDGLQEGTAEPSGQPGVSGPRPGGETRETAERSAGETSAAISSETEVAGEEAEDPEDELLLLGERCARTYLRADALHYKAMTLLAEFHRREGWRDTAFPSTAEWLAWRVGIRLGTARERLRAALALEDLPQTSEALEGGRISFAKARALTRVATPDNENVLLDLAYSCSAAHLERMVRAWKTLDRRSEITAEQIRHRSRRFSAFVDDDGMVVVRGRLDPEVGALLMRAVEAASDALFRKEQKDSGGDSDEDSGGDSGAGPGSLSPEREAGERGENEERDLKDPTPEQRRADAVGLICERALVAGFGEEGAEMKGTRADRCQVMLHVEMDTLTEDTEPGTSELEDGTRVSAEPSGPVGSSVSRTEWESRETAERSAGETSRRLACDCGVVAITRGGEGEVVGASARKRTVGPSLRRALEARDRGCRFPGCGSRFVEAHHVNIGPTEAKRVSGTWPHCVESTTDGCMRVG